MKTGSILLLLAALALFFAAGFLGGANSTPATSANRPLVYSSTPAPTVRPLPDGWEMRSSRRGVTLEQRELPAVRPVDLGEWCEREPQECAAWRACMQACRWDATCEQRCPVPGER